MAIKFNYIKSVRIPQAKKLKCFLDGLLRAEKKIPGGINYIFCSDDYLLEINKTYLQHNDYTDIITFDLSHGKEIIGEIYISVDRVKENAVKYNSSFKSELLRVMFHGLLHLSGYKDKTKREITEMRSKEEHYLLLFEKKSDAVI